MKPSVTMLVWMSNNRGVLTRIAKSVSPPVSPQFVHLVLRGERNSSHGRIEKLLKDHGAPVPTKQQEQQTV